MSLEAALETHSTLLRELIALWKTGAAPAPAPVAAQVTETKAAAPAAETKEVADPKKSGPGAAAATATSLQADATSAGAQTTSDEKVTYDQLKPLIIKLNTTKGREVATKLLGDFGVARGPELKPEQFASFFERITGLLAS